MTFSAASEPATPVSLPPLQGRAGVAHWIATVGLFCMPALVLTLPQNLLPYGILLLLSTLLAPDYLWRARGLAGRPDNVILYATSNRRHLMPRDMIENERSCSRSICSNRDCATSTTAPGSW